MPVGILAGVLAAIGADGAGCDPAWQTSQLPLPISPEHPQPSRGPRGPSSFPAPLRVLRAGGILLCPSLAPWHRASPSPLLGCGQSFPSAIHPHFIIKLMTILA